MYNELLKNQINKFLGKNISPKVRALLDAINLSYKNFITDRLLLEESMQKSAEKILEANRKLKEESLRQKDIIDKMKRLYSLNLFDGDLQNEIEDEDLFYVFEKLAELINWQREATLKLQKNEANLTGLIENTNESIWSIDSNYNILTLNSVFQKSFHQLNGHLLQVGECILSYLDAAWLDEWKNYYDKTLSGSRFTIEKVFT